MAADNKNINSSINSALAQGGGSLGTYEVGAYKDINEELSRYFKAEGRRNEPMFHIVAGTSIGAINAAILVNYVKENEKWKGLATKL
jgi:predicted acylesterase/phospholipase RssA